MPTIFDVADWFLAEEKMTHKKLQKLCYYAVAWSYAICPAPICDAEFEAWPYGPVCRKLYAKYRQYQFSYIPKGNRPDVFTGDQDIFLSRIWLTYADMAADTLEILSRTEYPWQHAHQKTVDPEHSVRTISHEDMRDFYRSIYTGDDV